ncbi:MAG: DUF1622 domain-containing protein [Lachnospiraceae bacterium]|nr:DUF1622 domain-containing protein [Lachnospiraceae bacterium]
MEKVYEVIESGFNWIIQYAVLLIELIGVAVLLWAIFKAVVSLLRHGDSIKLSLAEGIALSLEFKMGGELLRTVIVRDWEELLILGAVILLRAAMTFLIHWEITIETKREREKIEEKSAENAAKGK